MGILYCDRSTAIQSVTSNMYGIMCTLLFSAMAVNTQPYHLNTELDWFSPSVCMCCCRFKKKIFMPIPLLGPSHRDTVNLYLKAVAVIIKTSVL